MLPGFNTMDVHSVDSVFSCQVCLPFSISKPGADFEDLAPGKFSAPVSASVDIAVPMILRRCPPSKVFGIVVLWISVQMSTHASVRSWASKSLQYEYVDVFVLGRSVFAQVYSSIAVLVRYQFEFSPGFNVSSPSIGAYCFGTTANSTSVTYLIESFITQNGLPDRFHQASSKRSENAVSAELIAGLLSLSGTSVNAPEPCVLNWPSTARNACLPMSFSASPTLMRVFL